MRKTEVKAQETFSLSSEQEEAINKLKAWHKVNASSSEIFVLSGYAGTGKTTLIKHAISELHLSNAKFAAYTGKAALVMQNHGTPASTIHSLIYIPVSPDKDNIEELNKQLEAQELSGNVVEVKELKEELKKANKLQFIINEDSSLHGCDLLILDECSMIDNNLLNDLKTFNVPIVAIGDPGQLPPIQGAGALFKGQPDALLTQIHRQAEDNPIIAMSYRARNSIPIPFTDPEDKETKARRVHRTDIQAEDYLRAGQVITGKNDTRRKFNQYIRSLLNMEHNLYPTVGDKLICLKNNKKEGLFNGLMVTVKNVLEFYDDFVELEILPETTNKPQIVKVLRAHFDSYTDKDAYARLQWWDKQDINEFDFGYCITVHKAQGSQYESVIILDDKMLSWKKKDRAKWLYTGITRAVEEVTVVDLYK